MREIQRVIFQSDYFSAPRDMYIRGDCVCDPVKSQIIMRKCGWVSLNTYFNSLSVRVWKSECSLEDVSLQIEGEGEALIEFYNFSPMAVKSI